MKSVVFGIGRELITAQIKDTNTYYIVLNLTQIGIDNNAIVFLDDSIDDIVGQINYYKDKVDLIITTGGLGPTFDDLTLQAVSVAFNVSLELNKEALESIRLFYQNLYKEGKISDELLNDNRKKMAYIPKNAKLLRNLVGAAPGVYIKLNNLHLVCLPGVPTEMQAMFDNEVKPILEKISTPLYTHVQTFEYNINDESKLAPLTKVVTQQTGVYLKTLPTGFSTNKMGIRFTAKAPTKQLAQSSINEAKKLFEELLSRL